MTGYPSLPELTVCPPVSVNIDCTFLEMKNRNALANRFYHMGDMRRNLGYYFLKVCNENCQVVFYWEGRRHTCLKGYLFCLCCGLYNIMICVELQEEVWLNWWLNDYATLSVNLQGPQEDPGDSDRKCWSVRIPLPWCDISLSESPAISTKFNVGIRSKKI